MPASGEAGLTERVRASACALGSTSGLTLDQQGGAPGSSAVGGGAGAGLLVPVRGRGAGLAQLYSRRAQLDSSVLNSVVAFHTFLKYSGSVFPRSPKRSRHKSTA